MNLFGGGGNNNPIQPIFVSDPGQKFPGKGTGKKVKETWKLYANSALESKQRQSEVNNTLDAMAKTIDQAPTWGSFETNEYANTESILNSALQKAKINKETYMADMTAKVGELTKTNQTYLDMFGKNVNNQIAGFNQTNMAQAGLSLGGIQGQLADAGISAQGAFAANLGSGMFAKSAGDRMNFANQQSQLFNQTMLGLNKENIGAQMDLAKTAATLQGQQDQQSLAIAQGLVDARNSLISGAYQRNLNKLNSLAALSGQYGSQSEADLSSLINNANEERKLKLNLNAYNSNQSQAADTMNKQLAAQQKEAQKQLFMNLFSGVASGGMGAASLFG